MSKHHAILLRTLCKVLHGWACFAHGLCMYCMFPCVLRLSRACRALPRAALSSRLSRTVSRLSCTVSRLSCTVLHCLALSCCWPGWPAGRSAGWLAGRPAGRRAGRPSVRPSVRPPTKVGRAPPWPARTSPPGRTGPPGRRPRPLPRPPGPARPLPRWTDGGRVLVRRRLRRRRAGPTLAENPSARHEVTWLWIRPSVLVFQAVRGRMFRRLSSLLSLPLSSPPPSLCPPCVGWAGLLGTLNPKP